MPGRTYWVYIMTNAHHTALHTRVTNDLGRRVEEHRSGKGGAFTRRYNISKLVYFEHCRDVREAIVRENQIKGGPRQKKIALVNDANPEWSDLSGDTA